MANNYIPVITQEEEDRGRNICVGVKRNHETFTLPKLSLGELYQLKESIDNFLNSNYN